MKEPKIKPKRVKMDVPVVPVVGDAGIAASGLAFGKIVPVLIVDDQSCPDLSELIRVHEHIPEGGDLTTQWVTQKTALGKPRVGLLVDFIRPVRLTCMIAFDLNRHSLLIDQIIKVSKTHLMIGKVGDRYVTSMNRPKIHLDVPETGFGPVWDKIYRDTLHRSFRKKGNSKRAADRLVDDFLKTRADMATFSVDRERSSGEAS